MDSCRRSARLAAFSRCSHCPRASAASAPLHSSLPNLDMQHDIYGIERFHKFLYGGGTQCLVNTVPDVNAAVCSNSVFVIQIACM